MIKMKNKKWLENKKKKSGKIKKQQEKENRIHILNLVTNLSAFNEKLIKSIFTTGVNTFYQENSNLNELADNQENYKSASSSE